MLRTSFQLHNCVSIHYHYSSDLIDCPFCKSNLSPFPCIHYQKSFDTNNFINESFLLEILKSNDQLESNRLEHYSTLFSS